MRYVSGTYVVSSAALLSLLAIIVVVPADVLANSRAQSALPELALFNRCYSHLTQHRVTQSHRLRAQVVAGTLSAVDACMSLIDDAALNPSGGDIGRLTNESDVNKSEDAKRVLRTFYDFHRTWFSADDIPNTIPEGDDQTTHTQELYEQGEGALFLTRALFTSGVRYDEIVTGDYAMEALRTSGPRDDSDGNLMYENPESGLPRQFLNGTTVGSSDVDNAAPFKYATHFTGGLEAIQIGELLGVRPISANAAKLARTATSGYLIGGNYDPDIYNWYDAAAINYRKHPDPIPLFNSIGGGILGTRDYLLLNLGRADYERADGGLKMPRRWAKAIYKDLLCRDIPTIRVTDASAYVQTTVTGSTPPFRSSRTCMQCHASLDGTAKVARNVSPVPVPYRIINSLSDPPFVTIYEWPPEPGTYPRESGHVDADPYFFKRPPYGRLFYRSYDGTLVNKEVYGIAGLGDAIAERDDLYICAASRYLYYFTGIGTNIQEPGESNANLSSLKPADIEYRNQVIEWGKQLKSDQSLKNLIRNILESELYQKASMRSASDSTGGAE